MKVLVTYATHHGSTREIAERIAATLEARGLNVDLVPADKARDIGEFAAFVVGSALYCGWLKEAAEFIKHNGRTLASRAVWLFSSGPLGTEATDARGRDVREAAVTKDIAALIRAVGPRGHQVFFGAYDPTAPPVGFLEKTMRLAPRGCSVLPAGDFRDWHEIAAWATTIADELSRPVASGSVHERTA